MLHLTKDEKKLKGAHYTPIALAQFVAGEICAATHFFSDHEGTINILDPAVGDGELLKALIRCVRRNSDQNIEAFAFDTDYTALHIAQGRIAEMCTPHVDSHWAATDFLDFVLDGYQDHFGPLFSDKGQIGLYDLVIANPPYVRTQVLGSDKARKLAAQFKITGRVDLYYAFLIAIYDVLKPGGIAGVIVSNRLLTTKAGSSVRAALTTRYEIMHVWDLGDTRLFEAAVLPAVLLLRKPIARVDNSCARFTSIYSTEGEHPINSNKADNIFDVITRDGAVSVRDKDYVIMQGNLNMGKFLGDVWRVSNKFADDWLAIVDAHTALRFAAIGKVHVGVKTTADNVFIRTDWSSLPPDEFPELLRPLITHHDARRFKVYDSFPSRHILYPYEMIDGNRSPVELCAYPQSKKYLEQHRLQLAGRKYVLEAGREWFEIWVPHCPADWKYPKLVFRDISEHPVFWIDLSGAIVNGDCYWIIADDPQKENLLWLALGVSNSHFIEKYYDKRFNNKLYAGRRRFMTQYVEQFPLPDPESKAAQAIVALAHKIYETLDHRDIIKDQLNLDDLIYEAFGL